MDSVPFHPKEVAARGLGDVARGVHHQSFLGPALLSLAPGENLQKLVAAFDLAQWVARHDAAARSDKRPGGRRRRRQLPAWMQGQNQSGWTEIARRITPRAGAACQRQPQNSFTHAISPNQFKS